MERYCVKCGKKLDENEMFCTRCGTKAVVSSREKVENISGKVMEMVGVDKMKKGNKTMKETTNVRQIGAGQDIIRVGMIILGVLNACIFLLMPAVTIDSQSNTLVGLILSDCGEDSLSGMLGTDYTYLLVLLGVMLMAELIVPLTKDWRFIGGGGILSLIGCFSIGDYLSKIEGIVNLASWGMSDSSMSPAGSVFRILCVAYAVLAIVYFVQTKRTRA